MKLKMINFIVHKSAVFIKIIAVGWLECFGLFAVLVLLLSLKNRLFALSM